MQAIMDTARGLSCLAALNGDRALALGAVTAALLAGAWAGTLGVG